MKLGKGVKLENIAFKGVTGHLTSTGLTGDEKYEH